MLSSRLRQLVEVGCLDKRPGGDARGSEYHLTPMGLDLYPTALMFWRFDRLRSDAKLLHPESLHHRVCDNPMTPVMICGSCRKEVRALEVTSAEGPGAGVEPGPPPRARRRSSVTLADKDAHHSTLFGESVDHLADRWTQMVLAALFLGAGRFDEIQRECGIASNILAVRLKELVDRGLLLRRRYQTGPDRFEYVLTPKGLDMYPIALTLMTWGDRWMATPEGPPLLLTHLPCGERLEPVVVCESCGDPPHPRDVAFGGSSDFSGA